MNLNTIFPLFQVATNASGNWFQSIYMPHHPNYVGLTFRLQAAVAPPLALTNALDLTLGY
jgi:hypothetical protein